MKPLRNIVSVVVLAALVSDTLMAQPPGGKGEAGGKRGVGGRGQRGPNAGQMPQDSSQQGMLGMQGSPQSLSSSVGQIIPPFIQDQLGLTTEQRQALAILQSQVNEQLARILTAEQLNRLLSNQTQANQMQSNQSQTGRSMPGRLQAGSTGGSRADSSQSPPARGNRR